jgi:hypothetical protein
MHAQARYALAHPIFNPDRDIVEGHYWLADDKITACLTANIGME